MHFKLPASRLSHPYSDKNIPALPVVGVGSGRGGANFKNSEPHNRTETQYYKQIVTGISLKNFFTAKDSKTTKGYSWFMYF